MAIKTSDGRYYSGVVLRPGQPKSLEGELLDVRDDGRFGRMDCKYCYRDDAATVSSYEHFPPMSPMVQALCAECGAGLTPPELVR